MVDWNRLCKGEGDGEVKDADWQNSWGAGELDCEQAVEVKPPVLLPCLRNCIISVQLATDIAGGNLLDIILHSASTSKMVSVNQTRNQTSSS